MDLDNHFAAFQLPIGAEWETMQMTHGSGVSLPILSAYRRGCFHEPEAERALKHYGLDLSYGWAVLQEAHFRGQMRPK